MYWLNAALLPCNMYVPVKTLHLSCALLLSIKLFMTVDQTGCAFPTFNELGFIYLMYPMRYQAISI